MERGALYAEEKGMGGQKRRGGQVGDGDGDGDGDCEDVWDS